MRLSVALVKLLLIFCLILLWVPFAAMAGSLQFIIDQLVDDVSNN